MILYHGGNVVDCTAWFGPERKRMPCIKGNTSEAKMPTWWEDSPFPMPVRTLQSFADVSKPRCRDWVTGLFIDSGAFGAWKRGLTIDIHAYANAVRNAGERVEVYANLDVIGDPDATWRNFEILLGEGLRPLPVFHYGEDTKWLKRMVDEGHTYIGLGGVAKRSEEERTLWMDSVFSMFPDPAEVGFHGFGVTSLGIMTRYPWRSCDSTAAIMQSSVGGVVSPFGYLRVTPRDHAGNHFATRGSLTQQGIIKWLEDHEFSLPMVASEGVEGTRNRLIVSVLHLEWIAANHVTRFEKKQRQFTFL